MSKLKSTPLNIQDMTDHQRAVAETLHFNPEYWIGLDCNTTEIVLDAMDERFERTFSPCSKMYGGEI